MSREDEQKKLAKGVWCDSYNFYLKYHGRVGTAEMWGDATRDFGEVMKKFDYAPVCAKLMIAAYSLLEEESR